MVKFSIEQSKTTERQKKSHDIDRRNIPQAYDASDEVRLLHAGRPNKDGNFSQIFFLSLANTCASLDAHVA